MRNRGPLRVLFAVQGEGRGHLTQAAAVASWLRARGHSVDRVIIGTSSRRKVPRFALEEIAAPAAFVPSPNFVADRDGAIRLGRTLASNAAAVNAFAPSLGAIDRIVREVRPDVVVNFYEGMVGLWAATRSARPPVVAVAHQFMFLHPAYRVPRGQPLQLAALRAYTRLAGAGAAARIALSLYPAPDLPHRRITVVPPLLRPSALRLGLAPDHDGSLLVYLAEPAMAEQLKAWARIHPSVPVHCFWEGHASRAGAMLQFHELDGEHFLERMSTCRALVCTAGFESVSEALLLGRPTLMVPVARHFEQACNARDAVRVGAGVAAATLGGGLDRLLEYLPAHHPVTGFRRWVESAEAALTGAIETIAVTRTADGEYRQALAGALAFSRAGPAAPATG